MRRCCASSASYWRARFSVLILSVFRSYIGSFHVDPANLSMAWNGRGPAKSTDGHITLLGGRGGATHAHDRPNRLCRPKPQHDRPLYRGWACESYLSKELTTHHAHSVAVVSLLYVSVNLFPQFLHLEQAFLPICASLNAFSLVRSHHTHLFVVFEVASSLGTDVLQESGRRHICTKA